MSIQEEKSYIIVRRIQIKENLRQYALRVIIKWYKLIQLHRRKKVKENAKLVFEFYESTSIFKNELR